MHTDDQAIDWDAYASQYDLLAANNPSYRENIEIVRSLVKRMALPPSPVICDVGGGTGNFLCALSRDVPASSFVHLDADGEMNRIAAKKFESAGLHDVQVVTGSVFETSFPEESFDLILSVNALYAMSPQDEVLRRVRRWLKPNGYFLVIDFGRRTKVFDWGRFILGNMLKEQGVLASLRFVWSGLETIRQNRRGARGQAQGLYWLHTTEEFGNTLAACGFEVEELRTCYRGYCDLAVCRPNLSFTESQQPPP